MSDISKLIEALRAGATGGTQAANPILPLDQPVVFDTEKNAYVRAPDVPKPTAIPEPGAPAAAAAPHRPASSPPDKK